MWDPQWDALAATWDVARLDLCGFGSSDRAPSGPVSDVEDVIATMDDAGLERVHLVGASLGAGLAVEVALTAPRRVVSLFLCPPGGVLLATRTDDLVTFAEAERAALESGDLDAAVEANVRAWVVGPGRTHAHVNPALVAAVRQMQRRVFEIDEIWVMWSASRWPLLPWNDSTRSRRRRSYWLAGMTSRRPRTPPNACAPG